MLLFPIISCDREDDEPPIPVLYTGEVVEISEAGSLFTGIFKNVETDQVTDYGFLWSMDKYPTLDNSMKYSLPLPFDQENYSYNNNSSLISDTTYYMRIFVTYNGSNTYYGQIISFFSLGSETPVIQSVIPSTACFGDTITLVGEYFGLDPDDKHVYFGEDLARVLQASDTAIEVQVPYFTSDNSYFTSDKITISVYRTGYKTGSTDLFQLSPPRIYSFSPTEGNSSTDISVSGSGFHPDFTELSIGQYPCAIQYVDNQLIQAQLPTIFLDYEGPLQVEVANKTSTAGTVKVYGPAVQRIFPDTVFSYENLKLYGSNLAIANLQIEVNDRPATILETSNDSITVQVPGDICSDLLEIELILGNESKLCTETARFRQPENIFIETHENQLFNGEIVVNGSYLPDVGIQGLRLNGMNPDFSYDFAGTNSSIHIQVPSEIQPVNEWLSAEIEFCQGTQLSVDSVYHIPPPVISDANDTMYSFSSLNVSGENFNAFAEQNQIYLGDNLIEIREALQEDLLAFNTPDQLPAGNYPLSIRTNGQESNVVNVELVHRWIKMADLPEVMYRDPACFLHDNVLYVGGGDRNPSTNFYSYDLLTQEWGSRSSLPVNNGLSFTDANYGYLYGEGALYRYDFASDQWSLLSQFGIDYTTGFLYDNKIFILTVGIDQVHHYYDLQADSWVEFDGYTGGVRGRYYMQCVLGEGEAYLYHDWDIFILDLADLSLTDTNESQNPRWEKSPQGFAYNDEAYLYGPWGWEIYNTQDFSRRHIWGPGGDKVRLLRDGDLVYFLNHNELWTFDLTMQ